MTARLATDTAAIERAQAALDAAETAHDAACIAVRIARSDFYRRKSQKRKDAYHAAVAVEDTTSAAMIKARKALERAHIDAKRNLAQAIKAARAVANGVQLAFAF